MNGAGAPRFIESLLASGGRTGELIARFDWATTPLGPISSWPQSLRISLGLLLRSPDWLDDPRGPDVSPDMHWYPGVTFWQTAVDQVFANGVPPGHGHVYGSGVVNGWAALAAPPGWSAADTIRLRALIDGYGW